VKSKAAEHRRTPKHSVQNPRNATLFREALGVRRVLASLLLFGFLKIAISLGFADFPKRWDLPGI
jgi:hypothetical protein